MGETGAGQKKLLVVDDDEPNLEFVTRSLRGRFDVLTALNGAAALNRLEEHRDIAVILCDQRMPGMTGSELLARAVHLAPDAVRVLITAYSDHEAVIDAVNRGRIWYYLSKPVTPEALRRVAESALDVHLLSLRNRELTSRLIENNRALSDKLDELERSLDERTQQLMEARRRATEAALSTDLPPASLPGRARLAARRRPLRVEVSIPVRVLIMGEPHQDPVPHTAGWERIAIPEAMADQVVSGTILDLTESAARVAAERVPPLLARVGLTFELEGFGDAAALGLVISRRTEPAEVPHETFPPFTLDSGFGVLFEYVPLDVRHAIADLIQRRGT